MASRPPLTATSVPPPSWPPVTEVVRERGGVLLRLGDGDGAELAFVPADVATRLTTLSAFVPVPGARPPASGIALADGAVVTVLRVGDVEPRPMVGRPGYAPGEDWLVPGADRAVLCQLGGFEAALVGAVVVATGLFDAAPDGSVIWRGDVVPALDVRALYAQAEAATWAERASRIGRSGTSEHGREGGGLG